MSRSAARPARAAYDALVAAIPAAASLPRIPLVREPTRVECVSAGDTPTIRIKRDDLTATPYGGNKVRSLELLLPVVRAGDVLLTAGGEGSTHVLTTAAHARALGATVRAYQWRHAMHPVAERVRARSMALCAEVHTSDTAVAALARATLARLSGNAHWIPPGGTSPLGTLGHVAAALELAAQVSAGELPEPSRVVVPLGTGGTAAGLALGLRLAGMRSVVTAVRVAPAIVASRRRVLRLARRTARLLERLSGVPLPRVSPSDVEVVRWAYGGAYGRPLPAAAGAASFLREHTAGSIALDDTYSAKAFTVALDLARHGTENVLFWLTFDARWMRSESATAG
ncbi:MAG TPA: pyridoxal-phosphate dependent enzyme [Gemmatimonadaceae bacterium]|nr:pyridoxal-phosphate dependent enzyme [Gemmatimonadaceae bacterium]